MAEQPPVRFLAYPNDPQTASDVLDYAEKIRKSIAVLEAAVRAVYPDELAHARDASRTEEHRAAMLGTDILNRIYVSTLSIVVGGDRGTH